MVFGSGGDASYCAALPLASGFSLPHARSIKQPSFLYIAMVFGLFLGGDSFPVSTFDSATGATFQNDTDGTFKVLQSP